MTLITVVTRVHFADRVLEITDGMGADMFMEATGLPEVVYPGIERVIWEGRTLNSTVVVTARAEAKMPVQGEVLQVRRARIVDGDYYDGLGYGILREEWAARYPRGFAAHVRGGADAA